MVLDITRSAKHENVVSFVSYLFSLNYGTNTSNIRLNRNGENEYPWLIPNLKGKSFQYFIIKYEVNCDLSQAHIFPFIPIMVRVVIMNVYGVLSSAFLYPLK